METARIAVCYDEDCSNYDFWITRELADVNDEKFLYIETHVIDAPDEVGDGFTASDEGLRYSYGGQFPLQMELSRDTWQLSICREIPAKNIDGWKVEMVHHVSTLTND